jgi:hypothetical protein
MTSEALQAIIEREIDTYHYPTGPTVGTKWTRERIEAELALLRGSLVPPVETRIQLDNGETITGWVVAEHDGSTVYYDPQADNFCLAEGPRDALHSIYVDGDVVGVFMAR